MFIPLEGTNIFILRPFKGPMDQKMAARAGLVPKNELYYIFDILTYCRNDSYGYMSLGEGKVIFVR